MWFLVLFRFRIYKFDLFQELDLHDILSFDAELGKTLQELHALVCRKKYLESNGYSSNAIADLRFRGTPIEDLYLDFTLPGYPDYMLKLVDDNVCISTFLMPLLARNFCFHCP